MGWASLWCVCEGGGRGWLASVCVWGGRGDGQRFFNIMEGLVGKVGWGGGGGGRGLVGGGGGGG